MPTILVNVAKQDGSYVKYALTICAVIFITIVTSTLGYHVVLLYIYAIAIATLEIKAGRYGTEKCNHQYLT